VSRARHGQDSRTRQRTPQVNRLEGDSENNAHIEVEATPRRVSFAVGWPSGNASQRMETET
jgi:hypothetical protein